MNKRIRYIQRLAAITILVIIGYYLYDVLTPMTTNEKLAQIIHLEDRREFSSRLKKFLQDENSKVRMKTVLAIGNIGAENAGDTLFDMLSDTSWQVSASAAFALGFTGDKQLTWRLLDMAQDAPVPVCVKLVEAVGRLADSSMTDVVADLVEFLQHPSPDVRIAACMAIFRSNGKMASADIIQLLQDEPDEEVRQAGLYVLAQFGIRSATGIFVDNLSDPDPYVRSLAVRGLGKIKTSEAKRYLTIALNDANKKVVALAIRALSSFQDKTLGAVLAKKLKNESDEKLIVELLKALSRLKNPAGLKTAYELAQRMGAEDITAATMSYAATVSGDRAFNFIDSVMRVGDAYLRASCAWAYGNIGREIVATRLAVLLNDEDPLVRAAAFQNLIKIDSTRIDFYLDQALNDPDFVVVSLAVDNIATDTLVSYLTTLHTIMSMGTDIDSDLRRSLVEAMRPFIDKPSPDSLALEIVYMGLKDPEYVVRVTAGNVQKILPDNLKRPVLLLVENTHIHEKKIEQALKKYQKNPYATIVTSKGDIEMELYFDKAPLTVLNFIMLASEGFYDGLRFHRVVPGFVVQGGDPRGDGYGGPGYYIRDEYSDEPFLRGTVGIATSGKDTGGSQFFITLFPQPHLEGRYTAFGQVLSGMDNVEKLVVGDTIKTIIIQESES